MVNSKDTLELNIDASLFPAFTYRTLYEVLAVVNGASRDPPASVACLIDSHIFTIALLLSIRISYNNQAELVRLKDSSLR